MCDKLAIFIIMVGLWFVPLGLYYRWRKLPTPPPGSKLEPEPGRRDPWRIEEEDL